jgi:NAD(P)-dependent dehydrogenase (short-subunit alcohol dehydrogenase family)
MAGNCNTDAERPAENCPSLLLILVTFVDIFSSTSIGGQISLQGKNCLVTGAGGALGGVIARRLAKEGARLAMPERDKEKIPSLVSSFGLPDERLLVGEADLSDPEAVNRFVGTVVQRFGSVDVLVHAAGGYAGGKNVEDFSVDEWHRMLGMNLLSAVYLCRAVIPVMRKKNSGRIITIAAQSAMAAAARRAPYQVSKRGVITLTESIAQELRGTAITANAIAPSTILTAANRASMPDADTSRWVPPEDIADLVVYLVSDAARFVSGNVIAL